MAKFYWLVALTAAEVVVALKVEGPWKLVLLAFLSLWKAAIVLRYFMHLKSEGRALKLLMAFPVVLIVVLVLLFMTDGVWLRYAGF
jgi:caa(3)-type oxidase subunit IV